jgi:hypothetical protein
MTVRICPAAERREKLESQLAIADEFISLLAQELM